MTQLMISVFLTGVLGMGIALAEEAAQQVPTNTADKLESISTKLAGKQHNHDDCPLQHDNKEFKHKNGEPCPYHDKGQHGHSDDKCEHQQRK